MNTIFRTYHGIEWHHGNDIPELGRELIALIEDDVCPNTEADTRLVEIKEVEYIEDHNPPYLWHIKMELEKTDRFTLLGGTSVILWRYKTS